MNAIWYFLKLEEGNLNLLCCKNSFELRFTWCVMSVEVSAAPQSCSLHLLQGEDLFSIEIKLQIQNVKSEHVPSLTTVEEQADVARVILYIQCALHFTVNITVKVKYGNHTVMFPLPRFVEPFQYIFKCI